MLALVFADGNVIGLVKQDVGRHQRGVGEQPGVDVVDVFGRFVLELGHARQLAEHGVAGQDPAQFGVSVYVALNENQALFGIDAAGQQQRKGVQRLLAQFGRLLAHRQRVQVGDEIGAVVVFLHFAPVAHRAYVIAQRKNSRRLDAAENHFFPFRPRRFVHCDILLDFMGLA